VALDVLVSRRRDARGSGRLVSAAVREVAMN
jgi:hypothetical protein